LRFGQRRIVAADSFMVLRESAARALGNRHVLKWGVGFLESRGINNLRISNAYTGSAPTPGAIFPFAASSSGSANRGPGAPHKGFLRVQGNARKENKKGRLCFAPYALPVPSFDLAMRTPLGWSSAPPFPAANFFTAQDSIARRNQPRTVSTGQRAFVTTL
jgi:hypothetical protein